MSNIRDERFTGKLGVTTPVLITTIPTGWVARVNKVSINNLTTTSVSEVNVYVGGSTADDVLFGPLVLPASDNITPSLSNHTLQAGDTLYLEASTVDAARYYVSMTRRVQPAGA